MWKEANGSAAHNRAVPLRHRQTEMMRAAAWGYSGWCNLQENTRPASGAFRNTGPDPVHSLDCLSLFWGVW